MEIHIYPPSRCYHSMLDLIISPFVSSKKLDNFFNKWLKNKPYLYTYRARNAIYHILCYLKTNFHVTRVLVPTYICKEVIVPIKMAKLKTIFIDNDLKSLGVNLKSLHLKPNDVIIWPNLFGLKTPIPKNLNSKVFIIEDNASSFQQPSPRADFVIYSFGKGKEISSSEGGVVVINKKKFNGFLKETKLIPPKPWHEILRYFEYLFWRLKTYRPIYFFGKNIKLFLSRPKDKTVIKKEIEGNNFSICNISKKIVYQQLKQMSKLTQKSKKTARFFIKELRKFEEISIIEPPKKSNYFCLNLFVKNRNSLRLFLENKQIFTSVPWEYLTKKIIGWKIHKNSSYILNHLLQFLIDPTYMNREDILFIVKQIGEWQNGRRDYSRK